ncbi:MAG: MG2 domain-containing protein [Alphaproteobacteria bacterium]|nr:MG2 domain-containing protein [Alphaproteobacteria bacterium]
MMPILLLGAGGLEKRIQDARRQEIKVLGLQDRVANKSLLSLRGIVRKKVSLRNSFMSIFASGGRTNSVRVDKLEQLRKDLWSVMVQGSLDTSSALLYLGVLCVKLEIIDKDEREQISDILAFLKKQTLTQDEQTLVQLLEKCQHTPLTEAEKIIYTRYARDKVARYPDEFMVFDVYSKNGEVTLLFSHDIEKASVANKIVVEGIPEARISVENGFAVKVDNFPLDAEKSDLKITIKSGIKSQHHQETVGDVTLSVFLNDLSSEVKMAARGRHGYIIPQSGKQIFPVMAKNEGEAVCKLYKISHTKWNSFFKKIDAYHPRFFTLPTPLWEGVVDLSGDANRLKFGGVYLRNMLDKPLDCGFYVLEIFETGARHPEQKSFILTDLCITRIQGPDGLTVLVHGFESGAPKENVSVTVFARSEQELFSGVTDKNGMVFVPQEMLLGVSGMEPHFIRAQADLSHDVNFIWFNTNEDLHPEGEAIKKIPTPISLYTDKGIYAPGETIYVSAMIRDVHFQAKDDMPVTFILRRPLDSHEDILTKTILIPRGIAGMRSASFPLSKHMPQGAWEVCVKTDPQGPDVACTTVAVDYYSIPEHSLKLKVDSQPNQQAIISLDLEDMHGFPTSGYVFMEVKAKPLRLSGKWEGFVVGGLHQAFHHTKGLDVDDSGKGAIKLDLSDLFGAAFLEMEYSISAAQTTFGKSSQDLWVASKAVAARCRMLSYGFALDCAIINKDKEMFSGKVHYVCYGTSGRYSWIKNNIEGWVHKYILSENILYEGDIDVNNNEPANKVFPDVYDKQITRIVLTTSDGVKTILKVKKADLSEPRFLLDLSLDKKIYERCDAFVVKTGVPEKGFMHLLMLGEKVHHLCSEHVDKKTDFTHQSSLNQDLGLRGGFVFSRLARPFSVVENECSEYTWDSVPHPLVYLGVKRLFMANDDFVIPAQITLPKVASAGDLIEATISTQCRPGEKVYAQVFVVSDAVLSITNHTPPDVIADLAEKAGFFYKISDSYQGVIFAPGFKPVPMRQGGGSNYYDRYGRKFTLSSQERPQTLYSGVLEADAQGKLVMPFVVPSHVSGALSIRSLVWSDKRFGRAEEKIEVREPLEVRWGFPTMIAVGDNGEGYVQLTNALDEEVSCHIVLETEEGIFAKEERKATIKPGESLKILVRVDTRKLCNDVMKLTIKALHGCSSYEKVHTKPLCVREVKCVQSTLIPWKGKIEDKRLLNAEHITVWEGQEDIFLPPDIIALMASKAISYDPYQDSERLMLSPLEYWIMQYHVARAQGQDTDDILESIFSFCKTYADSRKSGAFRISDMTVQALEFLYVQSKYAPTESIKSVLSSMKDWSQAMQQKRANSNKSANLSDAIFIYTCASIGAGGLSHLRYFTQDEELLGQDPLVFAYIASAFAKYGFADRAAHWWKKTYVLCQNLKNGGFDLFYKFLPLDADYAMTNTDKRSFVGDLAIIIRLMDDVKETEKMSEMLDILREAQSHASYISLFAKSSLLELQNILGKPGVVPTKHEGSPQEVMSKIGAQNRFLGVIKEEKSFVQKLNHKFFDLDGNVRDPEHLMKGERLCVYVEHSFGTDGLQRATIDYLPGCFQQITGDTHKLAKNTKYAVGAHLYYNIETFEKTPEALSQFCYTKPGYWYFVVVTREGEFYAPGAFSYSRYEPQHLLNSGGYKVCVKTPEPA